MKTDKSKKLAIIGKKKYLSDGIKSNEADSKIERDQVKTSSAGAERSDGPHKKMWISSHRITNRAISQPRRKEE